MKHRSFFGAALVALASVAFPASLVSAANPTSKPAPAADAPTVASLAQMLDGFHWGSSHTEVMRLHNQSGGLFDQDYNPRLAKMQPGVAMQSVEAEREAKKAAMGATFAEFKDIPMGYDRTGIKDEYTYKNHESLMYVDRAGKRRYFFFFGSAPAEKLWKIYDEIPLKDGGAMGRTFQEAVTKMQVQLNTPGRLRLADPSIGQAFNVVDWQDSANHIRLIDRTADGMVGVAIEDRATLAALPTLRANKAEDPLAIDPSILAVTRGTRSDPNAAKDPAPASSAKKK